MNECMGDLRLHRWSRAVAVPFFAAAAAAAKSPPNRARFPLVPHAAARLNSDLQVAMAEKLETEQEELNSFLLSRARVVNDALYEALPPRDAELMSRGKRIRPVLCLAACELVGGSPDVALPAACAVEVIHKMSIRHGSRLHHRGIEADPTPLPYHCQSYLGFALENLVSATKGVEPEKLTRVVFELCRASGTSGIVSGEFMDMVATTATQREPCMVDIESLNCVHLRKTAALLEGSVVSGAILGGGSEAAVERLRRYARYISLLFEVVVDILDHYHDHKHPHDDDNDDGDDDALMMYERRATATYTDLLGLEGSKMLAQQLHQETKHQLDMFDAFKASPLYKLADYLLQLTQ